MSDVVQGRRGPQIESYSFGEVVIDGKRYRSDVIVFPDRVKPNWWREMKLVRDGSASNSRQPALR